ncbi:MAG: DEAD/DEAH box helicase family protein [Myxococcales bacterium]|nr:DEAD/DEAH box helicase family protein [Myxococcales bacterium]
MAHLKFVDGTLELREVTEPSLLPAEAVWDERTGCHRAPASTYPEVFTRCVRRKIEYRDEARDYTELPAGLRLHREPRPFQTEALAAWRKARGQGVVVLPTGAGKSHVALMAIDAMRRSTLVVVPTLDLVRQWYDQLRLGFASPVGAIGGGEYDPQPLTVTTYDSAHLHMGHLGNRFGMIVFDECHHLPGDAYRFAALGCLAPFRLGLSATPERADGRHAELDTLIGPVVYRRDVVEMAGEYLAEYEVERITVALTPDERLEYEEERAIYRAFVVSQGIRMSSPRGWSEFIIRASQSEAGRRAMAAHRRYKRIALAAPSKFDLVERLLHQHRRDRVLIFSENNATAYEVSRRFLVPVITHRTRPPERRALLDGFADGTYGVLATSKVLNEGVDVPDANVAIIISGSGSVREHVQRLGRILRKRGDKRATLYELVAEGTAEEFISERRREHSAYR